MCAFTLKKLVSKFFLLFGIYYIRYFVKNFPVLRTSPKFVGLLIERNNNFMVKFVYFAASCSDVE
jgi:hypothetical protein